MDDDLKDVLEAWHKRQNCQDDLIDGLHDQLADIQATFLHKDGHTLNAMECVARLDQRTKMQDGEIMSLIGEIQDMRNEIRTVHYLLTGAGRYGAREPRTMPSQDTDVQPAKSEGYQWSQQ